MSRNAEYWKERFKQLEEAQNAIGEETAKAIERIERETVKAIDGKIAIWYQRFADNNGISLADARKWLTGKDLSEFKWDVKDYIQYGEANALDGKWMKELENASVKMHISRLEALKMNVRQSVESFFAKEQQLVGGALDAVYKNGYYGTAYELQLGFGVGFNVAKVNQSYLDKLLVKPWAADGLNFSKRIWENKDKLIAEIHTELTRNIMLGEDPQKAIDAIAKKFNTTKNNAGALVMTEEAYFSSVAQKDCFDDLDVEQYEILATLDSATSEICRGLDGKVFPTKDFEPGVTAPPFHVRCRTTTVPYFADNFGIVGERAARGEDGKTYYIPADMTYEDWKKSFVDGGDKSGLAAANDTVLAEVAFEDKGQKRITAVDKLTTPKFGDIMDAPEDDTYSQARKDAAYWFTDKREADAVLRPVSGEVWKNASTEQKNAAYKYTSGSGSFNRPLRGYDGSWYNFKGVGKVHLNNEGSGDAINQLTELIDKSSYDFDIWLNRGIETTSGMASFLKIPEDVLKNATQEELEQLLLGNVINDEAFVSCGSAKGAGFGGHIVNIYAPKGTKMIYAEPFSSFGEGDGEGWDGVSGQSDFSDEFETIIQRGTEFRITKIEKNGWKVCFDVEVVKQR